MKTLYPLKTLTMICLSAIILLSCKEDADPDLSEKEIMVNSLVNSNWVIDTQISYAFFYGVNESLGTPDPNSFSINFNKTETGLSFTFAGNAAKYLSHGSFDMDENGDVSNFEINSAVTSIEAGVEAVDITMDKIRLVVFIIDRDIDCSDSSIPECGTGTWTMVFTNTNAE